MRQMRVYAQKTGLKPSFCYYKQWGVKKKNGQGHKGVYLNVGPYVVTPYIIEFELSFEDRSAFSIVFSNRFKRPDETNTLVDMIEKSYSNSRSFDASKYIYNQTTSQASEVSRFMSDALDAAKNAVLGGSGTVKYDATGLTIGVGSKYQIRMVDRMIAMTDDNWEHAKVGIGLIATPDGGSNFVVNAEVIGLCSERGYICGESCETYCERNV